MPINNVDYIYNPTLESRKSITDLNRCREFQEQLEKKYPNAVNSFIGSYTKQYGAPVLIDDPTSSSTYFITGATQGATDFSQENATAKAVHVTNPEVFFPQLLTIDETVENCSESVQAWFLNGLFFWANATTHDLRHPEEYITHLEAMLKDQTFDYLQNPTPIARFSQLNQQLTVTHQTPGYDLESPHQLAFAVSPSDHPSDIDYLPAIRYGLTSPQSAIVYAIQMPKIEYTTQSHITKHEEQYTHQYTDAKTSILDLYKKNPLLFIKIFGKIPKNIKDEQDSYKFCDKFYEVVLHGKELDSEDIVQERIRSQKWLPKMFARPYEDIVYLLDNLNVQTPWDYKERDRLLPLFEKRKAKVKDINPLFKGNVEDDVRETPPAGLLSLVTTLKMFEQKGITEVLLPAILPHRIHEEDEDVDDRISKQNNNLFARAIDELDGFEFVSEPVLDGYFHFRITRPLTSSRPVIQEVFAGIEKGDI